MLGKPSYTTRHLQISPDHFTSPSLKDNIFPEQNSLTCLIDSEKKFFNIHSLILLTEINWTGVKYIYFTESYSAHPRKL